MVKNLPANAGDMGLIPGPEDSTCPGATNHMSHNYWSLLALEPILHKRSQHNEKLTHHN